MRLGKVTQGSPLMVRLNGDTTAAPAAGPALAVGTEVLVENVEGRRFVVHALGDQAWRTVGTTGQPGFSGNWVQYAADPSFGPVAFRKSSDGVVRLRGQVGSGTANQPAFTLPAGYRPATNHSFPTVGDGVFAEVRVYTDGRVAPLVSRNWLSLAAVTFLAEQ